MVPLELVTRRRVMTMSLRALADMVLMVLLRGEPGVISPRAGLGPTLEGRRWRSPSAMVSDSQGRMMRRDGLVDRMMRRDGLIGLVMRRDGQVMDCADRPPHRQDSPVLERLEECAAAELRTAAARCGIRENRAKIQVYGVFSLGGVSSDRDGRGVACAARGFPATELPSARCLARPQTCELPGNGTQCSDRLHLPAGNGNDAPAHQDGGPTSCRERRTCFSVADSGINVSKQAAYRSASMSDLSVPRRPGRIVPEGGPARMRMTMPHSQFGRRVVLTRRHVSSGCARLRGRLTHAMSRH